MPRAASASSSVSVEVQARRRRGDGARRAREHRLVALAVGGVRRASDVRRQRRLAVRFEIRHDVAIELDLDELAGARDRRAPAPDPAARSLRPAAVCGSRAVHERTARPEHALEQQLDSPARRLAASTRAGSTRVSLNTSRSPALQQLRQLGEHAIRERARRRRRARASGWRCAPPAAPARSAPAGARSENRGAASEATILFSAVKGIASAQRPQWQKIDLSPGWWCPRSESNRHAV